MNKEIDFETNLIISYRKFEIFLFDIKNHKNIYQEEFKFRDALEKIDFNLLEEFLENNIFKIEKLAGNFVNNINIVIENKSILTAYIGIKKKNYTGEINSSILESMLTDVKDLFKENYNQYKIVHMIIDRYIIDGKSHSSLQDQISSDEICLEIKLISIPNSIIFKIENILKEYQIQVQNYYSKKYVIDFYKDDTLDISQMAFSLKRGINKNEVQIINKIEKKKTFFEKFFQLFG